MRSSSLKYLHTLSKQVWRGKCTTEEDPKDDQAVQLLRDSLLLDGQLPTKLCDYHTLLRFVRMRDYDILKAKDSFLKYLKWRAEFGVDAIYKEFKFDEYQQVQKHYPHGFHGVDRFGRPVYIERIGMLDINALLRVTTVERLVKHHVYEQEKTARLRFPACTIFARKQIVSTTAILDVKGLGVSSFTNSARDLFTEFQKIASNYYPETLNSLLIINAGSSFKILWKALKTFLDSHTSAKIQVLGSNFRSKLVEVIDPSNLPAFLGGECTCSNQGGCLLSDKGPWKDPEILQQLESAKMKDDGDFATIEEAWLSAQSTPDHRILEWSKEGANNTALSKMISQLELMAEEAKNKIRGVEAAVEETKQVLESIVQQISDLKMNLKTSANIKNS
ncbi:phosphatidylinositol/phosphatidylcholine transfer protein SFH11-like [Silene latifolia]|uniref:phosphatidylinositol/phosphatidylcholine transfer protein SFH11-like n=1 Tax=Silene latifolia TaxID=37657 RepID=UPI003D76F69A